jgi:hypothetical protein
LIVKKPEGSDAEMDEDDAEAEDADNILNKD